MSRLAAFIRSRDIKAASTFLEYENNSSLIDLDDLTAAIEMGPGRIKDICRALKSRNVQVPEEFISKVLNMPYDVVKDMHWHMGYINSVISTVGIVTMRSLSVLDQSTMLLGKNAIKGIIIDKIEETHGNKLPLDLLEYLFKANNAQYASKTEARNRNKSLLFKYFEKGGENTPPLKILASQFSITPAEVDKDHEFIQKTKHLENLRAERAAARKRAEKEKPKEQDNPSDNKPNINLW